MYSPNIRRRIQIYSYTTLPYAAKFMASAFRFSSASDDRGDKFVLRHPDTEYNINMKQVPIFWYENVRSTMDSVLFLDNNASNRRDLGIL